ncbi:unnamed protein product, partial [Rotaria sp. Silwood2]
YHAFFDPTAHLSLNDAEKSQCEKYIRNLIFNDVYPQKSSSLDITQAATTTVTPQLQQLFSQNKSLKISTYDDFISACGDQDCAVENIKEKMHYVQLPLLSNLAKVHLVACGSSVPSESAFSCSAFVARKERSRLSPENLAYSVFLKDKLDKN